MVWGSVCFCFGLQMVTRWRTIIDEAWRSTNHTYVHRKVCVFCCRKDWQASLQADQLHTRAITWGNSRVVSQPSKKPENSDSRDFKSPRPHDNTDVFVVSVRVVGAVKIRGSVHLQQLGHDGRFEGTGRQCLAFHLRSANPKMHHTPGRSSSLFSMIPCRVLMFEYERICL